MERIWYSRYDSGVPETINADAYHNLIEPFEEFTQKYSDHIAFSNLGTKITFHQLERYSYYFAAYLQQNLGLKKGDRFAIMLPNLLQYAVAIWGALRAGLVVVNVNPLYTARELARQINDAKPRAILVLQNFAQVLQQALIESPVDHVIVTEVGDLMGWLKSRMVNFVVKHVKHMVPTWNILNVIQFHDAMTLGKRLKLTHVPIEKQDIAFLQYTGGTTGVAKGAILTHRNLVANVSQAVAWIRDKLVPGKDTILIALPMYHIFSLTVCFFSGLALGLHGQLITNPRDMKDFIKQLRKNPPSVFVGISTLFNGLLKQPDFLKVNFKKIKMTAAGGMATQRVVAEEWQKVTGLPVIEGYGLTEASPVVTITPVTATFFRGSTGLPVPSTDISIRDANGDELPIGKEGELWVKGPQVMLGYWQRQDETDNVLTADGWLKTGDIMRVDDCGYVHLVDRQKDMIIVSGFNVYPTELEDVIAAYPGVREVAVIGIPSDKTGEAVKAFIVKQDPEMTEDDIIRYCKNNLTGYKMPKYIEFRAELPKSNVGKILRRELRT